MLKQLSKKESEMEEAQQYSENFAKNEIEILEQDFKDIQTEAKKCTELLQHYDSMSELNNIGAPNLILNEIKELQLLVKKQGEQFKSNLNNISEQQNKIQQLKEENNKLRIDVEENLKCIIDRKGRGNKTLDSCICKKELVECSDCKISVCRSCSKICIYCGKNLCHKCSNKCSVCEACNCRECFSSHYCYSNSLRVPSTTKFVYCCNCIEDQI